MILRATHLVVGALLRAALVAALSLTVAGTALAEDRIPPPPPTDHVPAWVFYSVLAACSAAGATMGKVVHYLWVRIDEHTKAADARLSATQQQHRDDLRAVNDLLQKEQAERRQDVERLKKEQADVLREVMVQIAASTEAIEDNSQSINRLLGTLHEGQ